MAATIKIKNSSTTGAVPTSGDLVQGELAVNVTDTGLYTENASGTVVKLNAPSIDDKNTGATKHLTISTAGNLGLGVTPSAWNSGYLAFDIGSVGGLFAYKSGTGGGFTAYVSNAYFDGAYKYKQSTNAAKYEMSSGIHSWSTAASGTAGNAITFTQAMTLDASGNLGLGTTSPDSNAGYAFMTTNGSSGSGFHAQSNGTTVTKIEAVSGSTNITAEGARNIQFYTNSSERARIDSSGNLLVGTTSTGVGSVGHRLIYSSTAPYTSTVVNAASAESFYFYNINATNNGYRFYVKIDGGIVNYSANNVNLSDERVKTQINLAGNYLEKICSIPVKTFKYKDQGDSDLTLGVIAQDVEAVAPELVNNDGFGDTPEDGVPLKTIYQTDLQYALMKAIQELNAKFEAYKATHP